MATFEEQIAAAIDAHGQWKARLAAAIESRASEFAVEDVAKDDRCDFGAWLHAEGKHGFQSGASYEHARDLHANFHTEAAAVLALALRGKTKAAGGALGPGTPFSHASAALVATLMQARMAREIA